MADPHGPPASELLDEVKALRAQVAAHREAEASAQRVRERQARILLDEMYQFAGLLDEHANLVIANKPALDGVGIRQEDAAGKPFWDTPWWQVSHEVREQCRLDCLAACRGQFVRREVEVFGAMAGTQTIVVDFSLSPIRDEQGNRYLLAEGRNITEKKLVAAEVARKTDELRHAHEKLKAFDQLKGEFFANVSHELRTPLTLILGPARRRLADAGLDDRQRRDLELIERNAGLLLRQVNNLLDLARLEARGMAADYARVDLAGTLRLVVSYFDAFAEQRRIDCRVDAPAALCIEADADKVQRIMLNLLSNAFKFTPSGGAIRCTLRQEDDSAHLVVHDSGPGVPTEQRDAIFERFRQLDGGSDRAAGGAGLGLSIVREFAHLHNGTVSAGAGPLGGTRFSVRLPLRAPGAAPVAEAAPPASDDIGRQAVDELRSSAGPAPSTIEPVDGEADDEVEASQPLVLVVEDNPDMNAFVVETLRPRYRVASAFNGAAGLSAARRLEPDLIVSDVMMPQMSGDAMVAALRGDAVLADVPVVMLTARADEHQRVELFEAGVQDYLSKPFHADDLLARVGGLIKRRRQVLRRLRQANEALERRVAERTTEVEQQAEQLRRLAAELGSVEQRERRRLAQAVHDHLQQLLVAAKMNLQTAVSDGAGPPAAMRAAAAALDESISVSRDLALELYPPVLYDYGLGAALNWLGRRMTTQHGLKVDVAVDPAAEPKDHDLQAFLFHAVRELLLNVVQHARTDQARVDMRRAGSEVEILVQDAGLGCASSDVMRRREQGGFGLFNIRERLHLLGGRLDVQTGPDRGCQVRLGCALTASGPADEVDGAPSSRPDATVPSADSDGLANGRRIRVMVVDDHKIVREGLVGLLRGEPNIDVVAEAADGREAVEVVEHAEPDVIVMDLSMPRMDGVEATRRIIAARPHIRVVGLSMHGREDMAQRMLEAGASTYLTKGGPAVELIAAIRDASR